MLLCVIYHSQKNRLLHQGTPGIFRVDEPSRTKFPGSAAQYFDFGNFPGRSVPDPITDETQIVLNDVMSYSNSTKLEAIVREIGTPGKVARLELQSARATL